MNDSNKQASVEHTPGQWEFRISHYAEEAFDITAERVGALAMVKSEANARRIVACVNACAGLDTEKLETTYAEGAPLWQFVSDVLAERDRAERALRAAGWICTEGAEEWRPPLGPSASPLLDKIDQLQAQLDAATSENEAMAQRLGLRMEELQQAVQARLAAEKQVDQLLAAIEYAEGMLTNLQPHIPQACYPQHMAFIDNYVDPVLERLRAEIDAIAQVKGGAA